VGGHEKLLTTVSGVAADVGPRRFVVGQAFVVEH
jgi:hypothetical protein